MKRVYLSGPMTGKPDWNRAAFAEAEKRWREKGWDVFNPAADAPQSGETPQPRSWYMRRDLREILHCTAKALLPGWDHSRGATFEQAVARELGLPRYDALLGEWKHG